MQATLAGDFSNATDLADDLVKKGLSFREAHEIVGRLVKKCLTDNLALENLTLEQLQVHHPLFDSQSVRCLNFTEVLRARRSEAGTSPEAVLVQLKKARALI